MAEEPFENKDSRKLLAISILVIVMVIAGASVVAFDVFNISAEEDTGPHYTTTYTGITIEDAYDLINTTTNNLTIIETRECRCKYNAGHIGAPPYFESIHDTNWLGYYNTTGDIIAYDANGNLEAIEFCENLVNHTYGDIYYLIGGFNAWSNANYPHV